MKVLVLAGGIPQVELIKRLREKFTDVEILLVDYSEHPAAEQFADKFYRESTLDIAAVERIAVDEKVDFLITVCTDQALNTVAEVSERLGLPCYIDAQTGKNVTNKRYMKKVFMENGVPTAKCLILDELISELPDGFEFPVVIKPVDCNSSKGVIKVENIEALKIALKNAIEYSRTNQAILEEYVEGKELSVDVYVHEGKPSILCVSESQKVKSEDKFLIFRSVYPAGIAKETEKEIQKIAEQIVSAFELKNCPMLIQMLYQHGRLYVVEFSARTGGGLKFQLIKQVSGVDIISAAIDATLGQSKPAERIEGCKFVTNEFMYCHDGIYDHVEGFQELQEEGVIDNYFIFKNPGTHMDKIASSGDRIASITITADTYVKLCDRQQEAVKRVKVKDVNDKDILHHGITFPIDEKLGN